LEENYFFLKWKEIAQLHSQNLEAEINIMIHDGLVKNMRPYSKNYWSKKGWGCSSSGRVPAWQVQGLVVKP
jgi:hypothetical protein